MARAGWILAALAGVVLVFVVLGVGDEAGPEVRWRVPLEAAEGGAVVAMATCHESIPRHVTLTLTRAGREVLATSGAWLRRRRCFNWCA